MSFGKTLLLYAVLPSCHISFSQTATVGSIEVYGNRKLSTDTVVRYLSIKAGDTISLNSFSSKTEIESLKKIQGVKHAALNALCCNAAGDITLYVGIGENDSVVIRHRKAPVQNIRLSPEMMAAYHALREEIRNAVQTNRATEDDSGGYALLEYKPARKQQMKFINFANQHFSLLAKTVKYSSYPEHRAAAAEIIAYAANKKKVAQVLQYAANDADEEVRNNATRALGILAIYAGKHPELNITIAPDLFIQMLNSIVWTDRNKGTALLMYLTETRNQALLNKIKQQALPSLIEMARWNDRAHAFFSFIILGRIAGVEDEILLSKNFSTEWISEVNKMVDKCCR